VIHVEVEEPQEPDWLDWKKRADDATKNLKEQIQRGEDWRIDETLYKEQKARLWKWFNGKCAYCEASIVATMPGDVEHYRPKKAVLTEDGKRIKNPQTQKAHPGYWWVAYYWHNLLPSCERCNRTWKDADGVLRGKGNRFPVEDEGHRAYEEKDMHDEVPLFLNPLVDYPDRELEFEDTGFVRGRTEKGRRTVEVLALNREGLLEARKTTWLNVERLMDDYAHAAVRREQENLARWRHEIAEYRNGQRPHSAVARVVIESVLNTLRDL
jgi:hypothetical protein